MGFVPMEEWLSQIPMMWKPLSTKSTSPVIPRASGLQRNTAASATSAGSVFRRRGERSFMTSRIRLDPWIALADAVLIGPAELASIRQPREIRVPAHVARQDRRAGEGAGELAHVLFLTFALEGEHEAGALARKRLGDRPRDAPAVGHAHDERRLPAEEPGHRPRLRAL